VFDGLCQRFSTSSTCTPRDTSAIAKGYAGKTIFVIFCFLKQDKTNAFLLLDRPTLLVSYCVFHKIIGLLHFD